MHTDGQWTTIRCTVHLFASMYLSALSTYMTSPSELRAERDWKKKLSGSHSYCPLDWCIGTFYDCHYFGQHEHWTVITLVCSLLAVQICHFDTPFAVRLLFSISATINWLNGFCDDKKMYMKCDMRHRIAEYTGHIAHTHYGMVGITWEQIEDEIRAASRAHMYVLQFSFQKRTCIAPCW